MIQPAVRPAAPEIPVLQPNASWKEMAAAYGNLSAFLTQKFPELLDCVANAEVAAVAAEKNASEARAAAVASKNASEACAAVVDALRRDVNGLRSDLTTRTQNIPSSGEIKRVAREEAAGVAKDVAKDEVENTGRHVVVDVVKAQLDAQRLEDLERDNAALRTKLEKKDEKSEAAVEKKKDLWRSLAKESLKPIAAVVGVKIIELIARGHL